MESQIQQDLGFIKDIRKESTSLLNVADKVLGLQKEWNSCFGGETKLGTASFKGEHDGLAKTDIEKGVTALIDLNTWLDEPGKDRRLNLQAIRSR